MRVFEVFTRVYFRECCMLLPSLRFNILDINLSRSQSDGRRTNCIIRLFIGFSACLLEHRRYACGKCLARIPQYINCVLTLNQNSNS